MLEILFWREPAGTSSSPSSSSLRNPFRETTTSDSLWATPPTSENLHDALMALPVFFSLPIKLLSLFLKEVFRLCSSFSDMLSGVVPLLLEWTGLVRLGMLYLLRLVLSGDRDFSRPSPLKLEYPFLTVVAGGGCVVSEMSTGSEPLPTSASLILIDRFFLGINFFAAFSSLLFDSFR